MIIWSFGGGTQSIAIALLVSQGRLPKPDRVVIADTGYEFSATWEYTTNYVTPMLAEVGLTIEVAPHSLSKVDLYSGNGDLLIPAYDATKVDAKGNHVKLPTFCSNEWKTRVVRRYIGGAEANPDGVTMWLGMSIEEIGRMKKSGLDWCKNHWPLILDKPMTRNECRDMIMNAGLPLPIKSRCKMCPHQGDDEWLEVKDQPEEWQESIKIDDQIFASHGVRLHRSGKPLAMVQLVPQAEQQEGLFVSCDSGSCWT
jgi:spore maturation protein SpmB